MTLVAARRKSGMFEVIESYTAAKTGDQAHNEDVIVVTDDFAAVIDGASDKSGRTYEGLTEGRFAAEVVADAIRRLPPNADMDESIDTISAHLAGRVREAGGDPTDQLCPTAAFVCYSAAHHQVWRVGDSPFRLGSLTSAPVTVIDATAAQTRATYIRALIASGTSVDEIRETRPGWHLIRPLIRLQGAFQNHPDPNCEFARGVLDGKTVPAHFRESFPVDVDEVILASDGYPLLGPTLEVSEAALADILEHDPLRISPEYPAVKGLIPGVMSFDDRSYLRIRVAPTR